MAQVVAKGTGGACLARTLAEELARDMRSVWDRSMSWLAGSVATQRAVRNILTTGDGRREAAALGEMEVGSDSLGGLRGPSKRSRPPCCEVVAAGLVASAAAILTLLERPCRNSAMAEG